MKTENVEFIELSQSPYGISVARLLPDYLQRSHDTDIGTPHRHEYYLLVLLEGGRLSMNVDFTDVAMHPGMLLLVRPGQVHQTTAAENISGFIMFFDGMKVDQNARLAMEQVLKNIILVQLPPGAQSRLVHLLSAIVDALDEKNPGRLYRHFLQSLLNAFFYKTVDVLFAEESNTLVGHPTRAVEIVRRFNQLLKENYKVLKRPGDYANLLNISVSYLNDTLKAVTGVSCSDTIQLEIIGEAQRLLFYTSKSVKEIAFELGYRDYKYFIRQFGNVMHTTPTAFRKNNYSIFYDKLIE